MPIDTQSLAQQFLHADFDSLPDREKRILQRIAKRLHISRNVHQEYEDTQTLGQRVADKVAEIGGSWGFITAFAIVLLAWIGINSFLLADHAFDPYPYIFLNLMLSMLAAIQAPVIMMSQNRQTAKDRLVAAHDYEVNLKAELEIIGLHEKFDQMRSQQLADLMEIQHQQLKLLTEILKQK